VRQALHAHRISFTHPATGVAFDAVAELPEDMREYWDALGRQ
jgi:23S rRNA-/tRNA-specific pseudouridylate synthase